jgi:hypothetical protein
VTVVRYESEALDEFEASIAWYEGERPGLGHRFAARVEEMLDRIEEAPRSFPVVLHVDGWVSLRRFAGGDCQWFKV